MNKTTGLIVAVVLVLVIVVGLQQTLTSRVIAIDDSPTDFRVFTQAICQETTDKKTCEDKIFFSCDGTVKQLESDIAVCRNRSIHVGKVNLGSLEILKE